MKNTFLFILLGLFIFISCGNDDKTRSENSRPLKYARLLRISEHEGGTMVSIISASDSTRNIATYLLVDRNAPVPVNTGNATVLRVPLENIVVFSSVHAAALDELGSSSIIKGVAESQFFKLPFITEGIKSGEILDVGSTSSPSIEKLMGLSPDGVLVSVYEGMTVPDLSSSGINYIKLCDNLETTPLGRAEWIKFLGLLTGKEMQADSIFSEVEQKYLSLCKRAENTKTRPRILTDNLYQGIWYVPGGKSYQSRLIKDAGGDYIWSENTSTGSLSLSFEEVYAKADKADIWLYKGFGTKPSSSSIINADARHAKIPAIKNGLWICDTSVSSLFEDFPFHPELLLKEYILIFHPELFPREKTKYFSKAAD